MTVPFMSRFTMKEMLLPSILPSLIEIGSPAPPRPPAGIVPVNVLPSALRVMVTGRPGLPPRPGCSKVHLPETSAAISAKDATSRIVSTKSSFLVIVPIGRFPGGGCYRSRWRAGVPIGHVDHGKTTLTAALSGSIYDNLRAANPLATFEDIVHACRMAEVHDAIDRLPRGYETEIGERGSRSG